MNEENLEKRRIVENHISAYHSFDVVGMLSCDHKYIEFKNFAAGEVNAATKEIDEFRKLGVSCRVRVPVR